MAAVNRCATRESNTRAVLVALLSCAAALAGLYFWFWQRIVGNENCCVVVSDCRSTPVGESPLFSWREVWRRWFCVSY